MDVTALKTKLAKLQCFDVVYNIDQIIKGYSHCCFKVTTEAGDYFAKYIGEHLLTANTETKLTICASDHKISPKLHYHCSDWLITHFIDAPLLCDSHLCINDKISIALTLMTKCHQLNVNLPVLNLNEVVKKLVDPSVFTVSQCNVIKKVISCLPIISPKMPTTACHGDINFSNIIIADDFWLIDFECGCLADREFDFAMMIAINELDTKNIFFAANKYRQLIDNKEYILDEKLVTCYLLFAHLINGLWYFSLSIKTNEGILTELAFKQFKAFDLISNLKTKLLPQMR